MNRKNWTKMLVLLSAVFAVLSTTVGNLKKPKDCQSLLTAGESRSGEYTIWINGAIPTVVYCDMVTEGGGWTVFQRRQDASTVFYRGWDEYKKGFGNKSSNFWLGLDAINELSKDGVSLRIDLTISGGGKYYAHYQNFKVGTEASKYKLEVSGYSGTAGDSMAYHNGHAFSTKDRDNDKWTGSCAQSFKGAWWYGASFYSNLNALYSNSQTALQYITWYTNLAGSVIIYTDIKLRRQKDCQTLLLEGNRVSKEYTIWIDGLTPRKVFCDMDTDGGGWNVIQRRKDATTDFYRGWNEYKQGFGDKNGNFWLGLDMMHALTAKGHTLRVDLKDVNGQEWHAKYKNFKIGDATTNYKLEVSAYSGNAGDSLKGHNNMAFSTKDADHDTWQYNCATTNKAAWWYKDCFESSLNAAYPVGSGDTYNQMTWLDDLGYGTIVFSEMKVRENFTATSLPTVSPILTQKPTSNGSFIDSGCRNYRVLSDEARLYTSRNSNNTICDSSLNGWYRFMYNAGNRMLDSCPVSIGGSRFSCGSASQGWLNGSHPAENEREVNRSVCFSTYNNCSCDVRKNIKVKNCGQYYVYLLNGVPKCNQRYCGARDKRAIVSCTDNYIRIELNRKYFNTSTYGSITLRDKSCTASFSNEYIILGSLPSSCGATMTETPNEIIFKNEVIIKAKETGTDMITRDHDQTIDIRCVYKRSGFVGVSFDPIMKYSGYEEGIGKFTFNFAMYKSEDFRSRFYAYPVKVNTRDRLFFQASAVVQDSRLTLLIDQCYSTPNMNRTYHKKYKIMNNGCPTDSTVAFHRADAQNQRFSMDAFRYLGNTTTVFIHCLVFLCHKSSTVAKCRSGCSGNNVNRVRRDVNEKSSLTTDPSTYSEYYLLEVGPVLLDDKDDKRTTQKTHEKEKLDIKFVVLVVGVAALAIIIVGLVVKKRRRPRPAGNKDAKEIGVDNAPSGKTLVIQDEIACS